MATIPRAKLWRFAVVDALRAFIVANLLPIWTAWYFSSWEANGERTWFLLMLDSFLWAVQKGVRQSSLIDCYGPELVKLVLVLAVGAVIGLHRARRSNRPEGDSHGRPPASA